MQRRKSGALSTISRREKEIYPFPSLRPSTMYVWLSKRPKSDMLGEGWRNITNETRNAKIRVPISRGPTALHYNNTITIS